MSTIRIAQVFEHPTLSGGERSALEIARRLHGRGFLLTAFLPPKASLADELHELGVETVPFARIREPKGAEQPADRTAAALAAQLDGIDIVHGNSLSTAQFTGRAGALRGIPAVSHVREIERLNPTRAARVAENDNVVAVSDAVRRHLVDQGVPVERVEVILNGVDPRRLRAESQLGDIRAELDIPRKALVFACIGQLSARKGTDVFLASAKRVLQTIPAAHALLVGARFSRKEESIAFERDLRETAAEFAGRLHALGWRSDVPAILAGCDLLVHCARQEPLGRVLLEAAALGVPAVATDVGGTSEIIEDGLSGWLTAPDDPEGTAAAIERGLRDPSARNAAGAAALDIARRRFCPARAAEKTRRLYESLVRR